MDEIEFKIQLLTKAQREDPIGFLDRDYEGTSDQFETNLESELPSDL